jgi:hypothetical protein
MFPPLDRVPLEVDLAWLDPVRLRRVFYHQELGYWKIIRLHPVRQQKVNENDTQVHFPADGKDGKVFIIQIGYQLISNDVDYRE